MEASPVVDCGGCVAPCCSRLVLVDPTGRPFPPAWVRSTWRAHGADVARLPDLVSDDGDRLPSYACTALKDGRCTVYDTRPKPCARYTCLNDPKLYDLDNNPRCELSGA